MFDSIRCRAEQAKKHDHLFFATLLPKELITKAYGNTIENVRASVYRVQPSLCAQRTRGRNVNSGVCGFCAKLRNVGNVG